MYTLQFWYILRIKWNAHSDIIYRSVTGYFTCPTGGIYEINRIGPMTEPCGTPQNQISNEDIILTATERLILEKKRNTQAWPTDTHPLSESVDQDTEVQYVKAPLRFSTKTWHYPASLCIKMPFETLSKAILLSAAELDWYLSRILCSHKAVLNCSAATLS